jgi:hypothetical protein
LVAYQVHCQVLDSLRNDSFGDPRLKTTCDVVSTSLVQNCPWSQSKSHVPPPPSCTPRLHLQNQQLNTYDKEKGAMTSCRCLERSTNLHWQKSSHANVCRFYFRRHGRKPKYKIQKVRHSFQELRFSAVTGERRPLDDFRSCSLIF